MRKIWVEEKKEGWTSDEMIHWCPLTSFIQLGASSGYPDPESHFCVGPDHERSALKPLFLDQLVAAQAGGVMEKCLVICPSEID